MDLSRPAPRTLVLLTAAVLLTLVLGRTGAGAGTRTSTVVMGAPVTVGIDGNEPIIKVAPDGTMYISALEYLYISRDHGRTWFQTPGTIYNNPVYQRGVNFNSDSS